MECIILKHQTKLAFSSKLKKQVKYTFEVVSLKYFISTQLFVAALCDLV